MNRHLNQLVEVNKRFRQRPHRAPLRQEIPQKSMKELLETREEEKK